MKKIDKTNGDLDKLKEDAERKLTKLNEIKERDKRVRGPLENEKIEIQKVTEDQKKQQNDLEAQIQDLENSIVQNKNE
jgi:hypothetical protein